jgi:hypothetical protein
MRQVILFESFKQEHEALVLFAQPVTPLYLGYLQNKKHKVQFVSFVEVLTGQNFITFPI